MSLTLVRAALTTLQVRTNELWNDYLDTLPDNWLSYPAKAYSVAGDIRCVADALARNLLSIDASQQRLNECEPLHILGKET